jgi:hypothetical protein
VSDGINTSVAKVTVNVAGVNDDPSALTIAINASENSSAIGHLAASDMMEKI